MIDSLINSPVPVWEEGKAAAKNRVTTGQPRDELDRHYVARGAESENTGDDGYEQEMRMRFDDKGS